MTRWVDVRVHQEDARRAVNLLCSTWAPVDIRVDFEPPATGPECEISLAGHSEEDVVGLLRSAGIDTYASRTRIGKKPAGRRNG